MRDNWRKVGGEAKGDERLRYASIRVLAVWRTRPEIIHHTPVLTLKLGEGNYFCNFAKPNT